MSVFQSILGPLFISTCLFISLILYHYTFLFAHSRHLLSSYIPVVPIISIIVKMIKLEMLQCTKAQGILRLNQRTAGNIFLGTQRLWLCRTCEPRVASSDFLSSLAPGDSEFRFHLCEAIIIPARKHSVRQAEDSQAYLSPSWQI